MITALFFTLIFLLLGVVSYLGWLLHLRVEDLAEKLSSLSSKVRDGEKVTVENFAVVEKKFIRIENDVKEFKQVESKAKEAVKAVTRLQREDRGRS